MNNILCLECFNKQTDGNTSLRWFGFLSNCVIPLISPFFMSIPHNFSQVFGVSGTLLMYVLGSEEGKEMGNLKIVKYLHT